MTRLPQCLRLLWLVGVIMAITSCMYDAAVRRLAPTEQAEFRAYSKIITAAQARTYLAKATAAERAAYARELGIAQRSQALAPQDREAVLAGYPRQGMSTEAMRFLWGEPYTQEGHTNHYEYWHYLGSSLSLTTYGRLHQNFGTRVDVYFVEGRVAWWVDFVPSGDDASEGCDNC